MAQPDYSLPPWEQGSADPAKYWLQGMQIGASVQHARNQLELQAQTTALETSVKQQQAEASHMLQQQQLEQNQAYKTAQVGLQQQKLQEAQEQINLKTQQAGQAFLAQQAYQQTVQQLIQGGMSEEEASMTAMLRTAPMMKVGGAGVAALAKGLTTSRNQLPEGLRMPAVTQLDIGGGKFQPVITKPGSNQMLLPRDQGTGVQTRLGFADLADLRRQRDAISKALAGDDTGKNAFNTPDKDLGPAGKLDKARYSKGQAQLESINRQIGGTRSQIMGGVGPTQPSMAGTGDDWNAPYGPSAAAPTQAGTTEAVSSNIKSIRPLGAAATTTTAPTATAPTPSISIPGLGGLKTAAGAPVNMRGAQIAQKQARESAASRVAAAQELYSQLKKANTGKGTYMAVNEWNDKLTALNSMLSALTPDQRASVTGEQAPAPSGYDTEGRDVPAQP